MAQSSENSVIRSQMKRRCCESDDDERHDQRKRLKTMLDNIEIPSDGLKRSQHGVEFQLNLLMLVLWRAYVHNYSDFRLATELPGAEKFDDVVFQSRKNAGGEWILRLIQAKHKEGKALAMLDRASLMADDDDSDFALQKYFRSFVKIRRRCDQKSLHCPFSRAKVQDVMLVTNTDFSSDELKSHFEVDSISIQNDELIGFKNMPVTFKYKLSKTKSESLIRELFPILNITSEFNRLVHLLALSIVKNRPLDNTIPLMKDFIHPLKKDVFYCDRSSGKDEFVLKFSRNFFDTSNSSAEFFTFRNALIKEVAFMRASWKFQNSKTFEVNRTSMTEKILKELAEKLATAIEHNDEIKISDCLPSQRTLLLEVVNLKSGKFRRAFIKPVNDQVHHLRELLKEQIMLIRNRNKVTNKDLESLCVRICADFSKTSLPADNSILNEIANALMQASHQTKPIEHYLSQELRGYQHLLTEQVLNVSTSEFFPSFILGESCGDGIDLSVNTKELRRILIDKIISSDVANETECFLRFVTISISKGLAKKMQTGNGPMIVDPKTFADQFYKLFLSSSVQPSLALLHQKVEITENNLNLPPSDMETFKNNIRVLGECDVFVKNISKLRLGTRFFESTELLGNLGEFRDQLIRLLGSKEHFNIISECEFDIRIKSFRCEDEECALQSLPQPYNVTQFEEFCDKFWIIVRYPNRYELTSLLETEMQERLCSLSSRVRNALLHEHLSKWMSSCIGTFYTAHKASQLFEGMDQDLMRWTLNGVSEVYFSRAPMKYAFRTIEDQICSFLSDEHCQILNLAFEEILLGCIRTVQTFSKLRDCDSILFQKYSRTFGHIFFTFDQLDACSFQNDIESSFKDSEMWNLLVIECDPERKSHDASNRLKILLKQITPTRKMIFVTKSSDQVLLNQLRKLSSDVTYKEEDIKTRFHDLATMSQQAISANETILLQESAQKIGDLLDGCSKQLIDANTLANLISGELIKVGNGLIFSDSYETTCYIERFFDNCVEIKEEVRSKCSDILIMSEFEEDFIEACEKHAGNPSKNIHWLRPNCGRLFWQQTRGNISGLVEFRENKIDSKASRNNAADIIEKLPENEFIVTNVRQKLMIISSTAGMGKTTILSNISRLLKSTYSDLWILRIDLNEYSAFFNRELESRRNKAGKLRANELSSGINFLIGLLQSNKKSRLATDFELKLLENSLQRSSKLQVALLLDGFDEISPTYMDIVLDFVQTLQLTSIQRLIITTRPCTQKNLEKRLGTFACRLNELSQAEQRWFLMRFWRLRLSDEMSCSDACEHRLAVYVDAILNKYSASLNDKRMEFTGIPLQLKLLAEVFEENLNDNKWDGCKDFLMSTQEMPELPKRLDVFDLFGKFVEKKYVIYRREKLRQSGSSIAAEVECIDSFKRFVDQHEKMALYLIFKEDDLDALFTGVGGFEENMEEIQSYIGRVEAGKEMRGIVNQIIDGKLHFIHRSFAEYFAANYIAKTLLKKSQQQSLHEFLLVKVLSSSIEFDTIRSFFDKWLETKSGDIPESTKHQIGQSAVNVCRKNEKESSRFLHVSCEDGFTETVRFLCECLTAHPEELRRIVNSYSRERTPLYEAGLANDLEAVKILVQHGADVNAAVLDQTVLQYCASSRKLQICRWLALPTAEGGAGADIHTKGFLGRSTLDNAINSGDLEFCKWLVERGLRLDTTDNVGRTPLHGAALAGHIEIVQWLISIGIDLSVCDKLGRNVLHYACMTGQLKTAQWLVAALKSGGAGVDINFKTKQGMTILHTASCASNIDMLQWILNQGFDVNSTDYLGRTTLHFAAQYGHLKIVKWLLSQGANINAITTAGDSVLHLAAHARTPGACDWLIDQGLNPDLINVKKMIPIQLAATRGHLDVVRKLLTGRQTGYGTHDDGDTLLHFAAGSGKVDICQWLLQCDQVANACFDVNSAGKGGRRMIHLAAMKSLPLVQWLVSKGANANCTDDKGFTVLHYAAGFGKLPICKWLAMANDEGGAGLATNVKANDSSTILHAAASSGNLQLCRWLLEETNLDIKDKNAENQIALDVARAEGHHSIVNWMQRWMKKK